jgi:multidrug efflux system membrane fusion protein
LTTVVSENPMWAYFQVDERTMLRIEHFMREKGIDPKLGTAPVQIGLANEDDRFPHDGVIDFVNNQVDKGTGTITVRGTFKNPKPANGGPRELKPGLFVRVRLPIGPPHKALLVPDEAVGTDQGKKYLYVVNDQDVVEYRPVEVGPAQPDGWRVITPIKMVRTAEGLQPAAPGQAGEDSLTVKDRVIVSGLQRVRPGMKVEPKDAKAVEAKK